LIDNVHIDGVFDHPVRVARRQVDVGNEGVTAVRRIDLAIGSGKDFLVGADGSKRQSPECRRLDAENLQPNDACIDYWSRDNRRIGILPWKLFALRAQRLSRR
jgi:hypothetical protein